MKISQTLPQFENYPTLFVVSGEFDARLILASNGQAEEIVRLSMNPREEAKEKQGFISKSGGKSLGAVSHHERYIEDLKKEFRKELSRMVGDIASNKVVREICIIASKYAANALKESLEESEKSLIHLTIYGLHTRKPVDRVLELYKNEIEKANHYIIQSRGEYGKIMV